MTNHASYKFPIGELTITADDKGILGVFFRHQDGIIGDDEKETPLIKQAITQLEEYFAGMRQEFDLPLSLYGTAFQKSVWSALREIPYGETRSYGEIAAAIGNSKAYRAVGMANNRNPVMIILPCHRVVGGDGSLVGYAGGLDVKKQLLVLEQVHKLPSKNPANA